MIRILWVHHLNSMCRNLVCPQFTYALDGSPLQVVYLPMQPLHLRNLQQQTSQSTSDMSHQSQHLLHKSFLALQSRLYLSWIDQPKWPKMLLLFTCAHCEKGHTHIYQLLWVLSHADVIAVTILSNKAVLNYVKGKYGRPETGDGVGVWEWGCRLNWLVAELTFQPNRLIGQMDFLTKQAFWPKRPFGWPDLRQGSTSITATKSYTAQFLFP